MHAHDPSLKHVVSAAHLFASRTRMHAHVRPAKERTGARLCVDAPAQTIGDCLRAYRVHVDLGSIYLERNFLSAIVISLSERNTRAR